MMRNSYILHMNTLFPSLSLPLSQQARAEQVDILSSGCCFIGNNNFKSLDSAAKLIQTSSETSFEIYNTDLHLMLLNICMYVCMYIYMCVCVCVYV
jgi:hypothetical protein